MKNLKMAALLTILGAGLASAQPQNIGLEDPAAEPHLENSSAWLAQASEEYWQKHGLQPPIQTPEAQPFISTQSPQDLNNWERLNQLSKGKKIRVVDRAFKKTKGRFIDASGPYLKFMANGKEVTLDRANVRMVALRTGPSIGERILMGLLAGAVIGAVSYAEASLCEKHGCQDDRTGEWYEGSGKGLSARSGYIATGSTAAGLGILFAFAETEDVVIYFQQERIATIEVPTGFELAPFEPDRLEGGNLFALVPNPPEEGLPQTEGQEPARQGSLKD